MYVDKFARRLARRLRTVSRLKMRFNKNGSISLLSCGRVVCNAKTMAEVEAFTKGWNSVHQATNAEIV